MTVQHTHGGGSTTVVESDREGPATALFVLIGLVLVGVLVWFLAFSGIVIHRGGSDNSPNVNINQNPPAQNDGNTNTNTNTNPNPMPS